MTSRGKTPFLLLRPLLALAGVIGTLVMVPVGAGLAMSLADGSLQGRLQPALNPDDPAIARLGDGAAESLRGTLDRLDAIPGIVRGDEQREAACGAGLRNPEVRDDYAHRCTVTVARYWGWSEGFPTMARSLHDQLTADGWEADGASLVALAGDYEGNLEARLARGENEWPAERAALQRLARPTYHRGADRLSVDYLQSALTVIDAQARKSIVELLESNEGVLRIGIEREFLRN